MVMHISVAPAGAFRSRKRRRDGFQYDEPIVHTCFLCRRPFQHGKYIRQWEIEVCSRGYDGNRRDGIVLERNPHLEEHLTTKGIKVQLNDRGWLCCGSPGYAAQSKFALA
jgi:hypothetical protein